MVVSTPLAPLPGFSLTSAVLLLAVFLVDFLMVSAISFATLAASPLMAFATSVVSALILRPFAVSVSLPSSFFFVSFFSASAITC
jgi:hypothetical protein